MTGKERRWKEEARIEVKSEERRRDGKADRKGRKRGGGECRRERRGVGDELVMLRCPFSDNLEEDSVLVSERPVLVPLSSRWSV